MDEIVVIAAVLAGAGAAGTAMYFQGRRTERRVADIDSRAAATVGERKVHEAK